MTADCDRTRAALALGATMDAELTRHLAHCDECRTEGPTLQRIATALATRIPAPSPALATRVRTAAAPLLTRNARAALLRTVGRAVAAALMPLPLVLLIDGYLVRTLYDTLRAVLPNALSLYFVVNYTTLLAVLLTLAYGAIPLLAERQLRRRYEGIHG